MVCVYVEGATFNKPTEVADGKVNAQKLTVKRAVPGLGRFELPGEESDRTPLTVKELLQDSAHGVVRGVRRDAGWGVTLWVNKKCGVNQGRFAELEGVVAFVGPGERSGG